VAPIFYAEKMQHAIRVFTVPLNAVPSCAFAALNCD
jgi:hypothetical protein